MNKLFLLLAKTISAAILIFSAYLFLNSLQFAPRPAGPPAYYTLSNLVYDENTNSATLAVDAKTLKELLAYTLVRSKDYGHAKDTVADLSAFLFFSALLSLASLSALGRLMRQTIKNANAA